jgi:hypothetical protein
VSGIALYTLNEVWNQVVASLQLNSDIAPCFLDANAQSNKTVIENDIDDYQENQDAEKNE